MNEKYYYVTYVHKYGICIEEKTYYMNSLQAQKDFIKRFNETVDKSVTEIVKKGTAHFNDVGVLVPNK